MKLVLPTRLLSAATVFALTSSASAQSWRSATEAEIKAHYADHTFYHRGLTAAQREFKTYYGADGKYDSVCCSPNYDARTSGTWSVAGSEVCVVIQRGDARFVGQRICSSIETNGSDFRRNLERSTYLKRARGRDF